jgi:frataxin-like iron-binding protein CyaY
VAFYSYPPNEAANPYFVEAYAQRLGVGITDGTITSYNSVVEVLGGSAQSILSGTTQNGLEVDIRGNASGTSTVRSGYFTARSNSSSYTLAYMAGVQADLVVGASSTVTRGINYYVGTPSVSGTLTNRAGIADNASFVGSFFLHSTSAFKSFMTGAIGHAREDVASAATITALSSSRNFVKLTGSTATALQGITAGIDGQRLIVVNLTGANMTVQNENAGATAANRITTMTAADIATTTNGVAEFVYDTGSSRWICLYVTA